MAGSLNLAIGLGWALAPGQATPGEGGGVQPSPGAALLVWDTAISDDDLVQWDDETGTAQYLEWDI